MSDLNEIFEAALNKRVWGAENAARAAKAWAAWILEIEDVSTAFDGY